MWVPSPLGAGRGRCTSGGSVNELAVEQARRGSRRRRPVKSHASARRVPSRRAVSARSSGCGGGRRRRGPDDDAHRPSHPSSRTARCTDPRLPHRRCGRARTRDGDWVAFRRMARASTASVPIQHGFDGRRLLLVGRTARRSSTVTWTGRCSAPGAPFGEHLGRVPSATCPLRERSTRSACAASVGRASPREGQPVVSRRASRASVPPVGGRCRARRSVR
jgi:hypothetical protein